MRPDEEIIELYQYFLLKKWNCIIICDEIKCTKRNIWIYFHISFPGVVSIKKIKYTKQLSQICLHFFLYTFFLKIWCVLGSLKITRGPKLKVLSHIVHQLFTVSTFVVFLIFLWLENVYFSINCAVFSLEIIPLLKSKL